MILTFQDSASAQEVVLKDNFFYLDGKKFFMKGIGYEAGAVPGSLPWSRTFDPVVLRSDMRRIVGGGFNTIRTWAPLTVQELDVLKEFDIRIIMGIWIDNAGNVNDPAFVSESEAKIREMMAYSKDYPAIIAYLIMGEPELDVIARAGYENTMSFLKKLADIVRASHPGRPVSISNGANCTNIDTNVFDFSAYNVYIYNPVTVNYLHGYAEYIRYLRRQVRNGIPLLITEYGLSVSPTGPGNWGYGGNSLTLQASGDIYMYKQLVDGGATGAFLFNYSDGWWKGGDERIHNDNPEEWFGLVSYSKRSDKIGQERPVWKAVREYQSVVITQPRSGEIYNGKVPLELFINDTIDQVNILMNGQVIRQLLHVGDYVADSLDLEFGEARDINLVFNCLDAAGNLVKTEEKSILLHDGNLVLPSIQIQIENPNFWKDGYMKVNYQVHRPAGYTSNARLDYIYYPHIGWNYGDNFETTLPAGEWVQFSATHSINSAVNVITVGAAFDVNFGNFNKRIVNQLVVSRINTLATRPDIISWEPETFRLWPNPASDHFSLAFEPGEGLVDYNLSIMDCRGRCVWSGKTDPGNHRIDISRLDPGVYFIRVIRVGNPDPVIRKLIKISRGKSE